jgi:hypothetical protein
MNFTEVICFRIPQFIQTKIRGHLQLFGKRKKLTLNRAYQGPNYKIEEIKFLFKTHPFNNLFQVFTKEIDIYQFNEWRKDVSTGITSPLAYYGNISKQDCSYNGDVKFIAEISRMEFLPFMALKGIVDDNEQMLLRINKILLTWNSQNPYLKSINWTSGIEVAIRAVNLIYTHHILNHFKQSNNEINRLIVEIISNSYHFLKNHLSLYSSANNHLMAELMGLTVIGSYFKITKRNQSKWENMFFEQIEKQINTDGVNMELCTRYHAEVTDQILIGILFLEGANHNIPTYIWERFKKTFHFTEHVDYFGNETIFGDNDEGSVINPFFHPNFSLYKSQLQTSNFLFDTQYNSNGKLDFRNYLIFGSKYKAEKFDSVEEDKLFQESGYCFFYNHTSKTKLSFDCGNLGDDISAAHGHSDIFHFNLEAYGLAFIIDSGTYQYHSRYEKWRNYFKGIKAHNTVSINDKNHAYNNGRMSWLNRPKTWVDSFEVSKDMIACKATTNAFEKEGIELSRSIIFQNRNNKVTILDSAKADKNLTYELKFFLHFHPETTVFHNGEEIVLTRKEKKIILINKMFTKANLYKGVHEKESILGWHSKNYASKSKITSLMLALNPCGSFALETDIFYD